VEPAGRLAEMQLLGHGEEGPDVSQLHLRMISSAS
jgi:hypothetical protein